MAIKIAKESIPGSNFQQEMTMMLKLSHPNIVHFYGLVEQGKIIYYYANWRIRSSSHYLCMFASQLQINPGLCLNFYIMVTSKPS